MKHWRRRFQKDISFLFFSAVAAPSSTHAGVAFVAMLCFLFAMSIAWFGYAYFFPHTWSGRLLIKVGYAKKNRLIFAIKNGFSDSKGNHFSHFSLGFSHLKGNLHSSV